VLSLIGDQVGLDVHDNAPDGFRRLDGQVKVDIFIEDVERLLDINGPSIDGARISEVDQFAEDDTVANSSEQIS
jgi:hypothetical protein